MEVPTVGVQNLDKQLSLLRQIVKKISYKFNKVNLERINSEVKYKLVS